MKKAASKKKEKEPKDPREDTVVLLPDFDDKRCSEVEERYGLVPQPSQIRIAQAPSRTTKIADVFNGGVDLAHPFLDEAKKEKRIVPTMIQRLSTDGQLPNETTMCCFWCRHGFDSPPIGCPTRFVPSQITKQYVSVITKDPYIIKQNVTSAKKARLALDMPKPDGISISVVEKDYYETDGVFCSFNCCLAFVEDRRTDPLYVQSRQLLFKMYNDSYGKYPAPDDILPAPHWRLLRSYGGHLSIDEFRACFNTVQFTLYNRVATRPKMNTLGFLFDEKHKF
jgi:hypothetical protein